MLLDKQELVRMLRTEGDNDTADKVESQLPDQVDTDKHGDQLEAVGPYPGRDLVRQERPSTALVVWRPRRSGER